MNEFPILLYTTPEGGVKVNAVLEGETLWLTQAAMAALFDVVPQNITYHLKKVYESGELVEMATCKEFLQVQNEGNRQVSRNLSYYNLDAIIAVGYRINSRRATQFRIWATQVLREYIIKGFALNDERMKQGGAPFGKDYFRELLERVQAIRTSERRIWQQITDIFAECSIDYDKDSPITREFYGMVQNKFHYAISGETAAEIIHGRVDRAKPNLGLTTWKRAPEGRILKSDVLVAKNYLTERQIRQLELAVSGFFDHIESLILREQTFTMKEFAESVDAFLSFGRYQILKGRGLITREAADAKAIEEYDAYNRQLKFESDFDRQIKKFLDGSGPRARQA